MDTRDHIACYTRIGKALQLLEEASKLLAAATLDAPKDAEACVEAAFQHTVDCYNEVSDLAEGRSIAPC